jgi:ribose/xylose/arabinose/galactoside ABC-type transport system permease subunit
MSSTAPPFTRTVQRGLLSRLGARLGLPVGIVATLIVGSLLNDRFLTVQNLTNVLINMSIVGIIVVGMTFVFVTRGLADLSVPATVAIGGLLVLGLQPSIGTIPAAMVGVLAAAIAGAVNGLLVGYAGLNPVITTLATGAIVLGIAQVFVGGVIVYGSDADAQAFLTGRVFGVVPVIVLIFLAIVVAGHLVLSRTVIGRWSYAVGSNPLATQASAVPVKRVRAFAFVLTGTLAGVSGVLLGVTLQTARPGIGMGYEFDAITAVVVGGVSLLGGSGTVLYAFGGLLFVQLLTNIMVLQGVATEPQGLVKGALIAGAVAVDVALRRRGGRQ